MQRKHRGEHRLASAGVIPAAIIAPMDCCTRAQVSHTRPQPMHCFAISPTPPQVIAERRPNVVLKALSLKVGGRSSVSVSIRLVRAAHP